MKKNVFISSTYVDLIDHRKVIWNLLENYEVNVKGMEAFGARKETPLETCLNEVNQSDIYIGIIGYRFGSIEKNSGKSYTQLEYERAIKEKKEILIYLINEKDSKVSIEHIDFDENRTKLQNFKTILKDKHTIDTFTTAESLSSRLERRLDELLVESQKNETGKEDYNKSKNIIERFLLLPKTYSDSDVKLTVQFKGNAYPISKEVCHSFGFSYGRTIGIPISIPKPETTTSELDSLIIEEKDVDLFFEKTEGSKIEIVARLLFVEERIESIRANFFDYKSTSLKENPDFKSYLPATDSYGSYSLISNMYIRRSEFQNPKYIETSELIKGEGKAILVLKKVIQ